MLLFYHTCLPSCTKGWRILVPWRDDSWGSSNSTGPFCCSEVPPRRVFPSISIKKKADVSSAEDKSCYSFSQNHRLFEVFCDGFTLSSLTSVAEACSTRAGCLGCCPALTPVSQDFKLRYHKHSGGFHSSPKPWLFFLVYKQQVLQSMYPIWLAKHLCPCLCAACQADTKIKSLMNTTSFNHEASSFMIYKEVFFCFFLLFRSSVGNVLGKCFSLAGFHFLICLIPAILSLFPEQKSTQSSASPKSPHCLPGLPSPKSPYLPM